MKVIGGVVAVFLLILIVYKLNSDESKISDILRIKENYYEDETTDKKVPEKKISERDSLYQHKLELEITQRKLIALEEKIRALEESPSKGLGKRYPPVKYLNYKNRKRILITGGAGFVGSHLVDVLMQQGHEVVVADNFFTGRKRNVEQWLGHPNFELIHHDIVNPLFIEVDEIYHLASPASPPHYMYNPVKTIKTNTMGTINMLGLAKRVMAKVLVASTSEVYGDPTVHPQPETYWGHVNPIGPRACYDKENVCRKLYLMLMLNRRK
uniref:UDP-glucuronic acid decarboxylase 1 n=1 Tax=Megaselia scalaris TaxID=36166 RepID=T1GCA9_MEGSC